MQDYATEAHSHTPLAPAFLPTTVYISFPPPFGLLGPDNSGRMSQRRVPSLRARQFCFGYFPSHLSYLALRVQPPLFHHTEARGSNSGHLSSPFPQRCNMPSSFASRQEFTIFFPRCVVNKTPGNLVPDIRQKENYAPPPLSLIHI